MFGTNKLFLCCVWTSGYITLNHRSSDCKCILWHRSRQALTVPYSENQCFLYRRRTCWGCLTARRRAAGELLGISGPGYWWNVVKETTRGGGVGLSERPLSAAISNCPLSAFSQAASSQSSLTFVLWQGEDNYDIMHSGTWYVQEK